MNNPNNATRGVIQVLFVAAEADVTEWYIVETEADPKSIANMRGCFEFLKSKGRA